MYIEGDMISKLVCWKTVYINAEIQDHMISPWISLAVFQNGLIHYTFICMYVCIHYTCICVCVHYTCICMCVSVYALYMYMHVCV